MKNLINAYHQIIFTERHHTNFNHLKVIFENQMINFKNILTEMNTNVYPIPKEVLSYFVKKIFDNGFIFTCCYSMKLIIELIKKSTSRSSSQLCLYLFFICKNCSFSSLVIS